MIYLPLSISQTSAILDVLSNTLSAENAPAYHELNSQGAGVSEELLNTTEHYAHYVATALQNDDRGEIVSSRKNIGMLKLESKALYNYSCRYQISHHPVWKLVANMYILVKCCYTP